MVRYGTFALAIMLSMVVTPGISMASNLLELSSKPSGDTILSIGSVPEKKNKQLNLGGLRTEAAVLPPLPLTRQQRMALRAKHAVQRQKEVTAARRSGERKTTKPRVNRKKKKVEVEQEIVLFDENNQPALQ